MKINKVIGYQVLDSRGRPTVAAAISLTDGTTHTARVPSGASTGKHEAKELRDDGSKHAEKFYAGLSVQQAVANINEKIALSPYIILSSLISHRIPNQVHSCPLSQSVELIHFLPSPALVE